MTKNLEKTKQKAEKTKLSTLLALWLPLGPTVCGVVFFYVFLYVFATMALWLPLGPT